MADLNTGLLATQAFSIRGTKSELISGKKRGLGFILSFFLTKTENSLKSLRVQILSWDPFQGTKLQNLNYFHS